MLLACGDEPRPRKLELIDAPPAGDVTQIIVAELAQAAAAHDTLLVYVGAEWCEPCKAFHDAAAAGQLDEPLGALRVVVFDADRDGTALEAAGYRSHLIPLFAVPRVDGKASGKQIEGAVKNRDAIEQLVPRLRALVGR